VDAGLVPKKARKSSKAVIFNVASKDQGDPVTPDLFDGLGDFE